MPERRLDAHLSQWVVQSLARLLATYAVVQGAGIIVGGAERWQAPSLVTAMLVPGAPESWGVVLAALGAVTLAATFRPRLGVVAWCLFGIATWDLFFALSLLVSLTQQTAAPTTGMFVYGHQAVLACVLAVAYRRSRP